MGKVDDVTSSSMAKGIRLKFPAGTPLGFGTAATEFSAFCVRMYTTNDAEQEPPDEQHNQDQDVMWSLLPCCLSEIITWAHETDTREAICVYCKVSLEVSRDANLNWKAFCVRRGVSEWPVWFGVDRKWYESQEREVVDSRMKNTIRRWKYETDRRRALISLFSYSPSLPDLAKELICKYYPAA